MLFDIDTLGSVADQAQLMDFLLQNYSAASRPVPHASQAVNVTVGLHVTDIQSVDQISGKVIANVWYRYNFSNADALPL